MVSFIDIKRFKSTIMEWKEFLAWSLVSFVTYVPNSRDQSFFLLLYKYTGSILKESFEVWLLCSTFDPKSIAINGLKEVCDYVYVFTK